MTTAQLSKRIHVLKKKIHRFEERFEEERKYRVSSRIFLRQASQDLRCHSKGLTRHPLLP